MKVFFLPLFFLYNSFDIDFIYFVADDDRIMIQSEEWIEIILLMANFNLSK